MKMTDEMLAQLKANMAKVIAENEKYKKALENVRKDCELANPSFYCMSSIWNIANEALEDDI